MANCEIPEEIVTNILRRLPVKSLMRFQCVSPAWRVLIKSPFFRKMHINHQKLLKNDGSSSSRNKEDEYILVLSSPQTEDGNVEFSFFTRGHGGELVPIQAPTAFPVFPHSKLELCAPCNGIFCAVAKIDEEEPSIYLCNPATRQSRRLPYRPFGFQPEKFPRSGVSYVERAAWGFGLDPRTDEYKLFSVMYYGTPGDRYYFDFDGTDDPFDTLLASHPNGVLNHGIYQFEIYELGSNTWREVEVALPDTPGLVRRRKNESYVYSCDQWRGGGLFLNGCFYWLYTRRTILCFDICSETLQAIEPPFLFQQRVDLVVLGDSLALVAQVRGFPISIWVMEESGDDDSWVKRFRIAPYTIPLHPLHAWKDDDGDLLLFQADEPNNIETLVSCNGSVGAYHAYPIRALAERYLVLRAIVISDQTLVSVESTT